MYVVCFSCISWVLLYVFMFAFVVVFVEPVCHHIFDVEKITDARLPIHHREVTGF